MKGWWLYTGFLLSILMKELFSFSHVPVFRHSLRRLHTVNTAISTSSDFLRNNHSYYNMHKVISNESHEIAKIYSTYNHKYSLIFYKNGHVVESFNQTLKLKCNQDIIQLNIVSMNYFRKLYEDLLYLRRASNATI